VIILALVSIEAMISLALISVMDVSIFRKLILLFDSKTTKAERLARLLRDSLRLRFWLPGVVRRTGHVRESAPCFPAVPFSRNCGSHKLSYKPHQKHKKIVGIAGLSFRLEAADSPQTNGITA
jgi:hypothetical protein